VATPPLLRRNQPEAGPCEDFATVGRVDAPVATRPGITFEIWDICPEKMSEIPHGMSQVDSYRGRTD
jgi:hypothetical protein